MLGDAVEVLVAAAGEIDHHQVSLRLLRREVEHAGAADDEPAVAEFCRRWGIADKIVARHVVTPADLEREYGLSGGHPMHGEHALDQFFAWRPLLYRT